MRRQLLTFLSAVRYQTSVALFFTLLLSSCIFRDSSDDSRMIEMSVGEGSKRLTFFIGTCVQFRDESGVWPAEVADVKRVVPNSDVTLERLRMLIRLRQNRRGLVLVDKRSGEAVFTVANESTPEHPVLLGGDGGG